MHGLEPERRTIQVEGMLMRYNDIDEQKWMQNSVLKLVLIHKIYDIWEITLQKHHETVMRFLLSGH